MKKIFFLCIIVTLLPALSFGECQTTTETLMYFDPNRFLFVDQVGSISPHQGVSLIMNDIISGKALLIPKDTKIMSIKDINEFICVAIINGTPLIAIKKHISCEK